VSDDVMAHIVAAVELGRGGDPYGMTVKNAMESITTALADGSTEPLPG
jgi:hypothetical protein